MLCLFQQLIVDDRVEVRYVLLLVVVYASKKVIFVFYNITLIHLDALSIHLLVKDFKELILVLFWETHWTSL